LIEAVTRHAYSDLVGADDRPLAAAAAAAIRSPANAKFVSAASIWEAEIKAQLGKLKLEVDLAGGSVAHGFEPLEITFAHTAAAGRLPPHHGDPFDRMLVAQAQLEGLTIVSRDPVFDRYSVAVLRA
jgi:PIN domain nuclease of toxin-antitoxin system